MENLGHGDTEGVVEVACEGGPGGVHVVAHGVEVQVPGGGHQDGGQVTDCHGEEDTVGGGLHTRPGRGLGHKSWNL